MTAFDLVIFDCDGVVVDSEVLSCECLARTLVRYGVPIDVDGVYGAFLGRSFASVVAHYEAVKGVALPDSFRTELRAAMEEAFAASLQPIADIETVLASLHIPFCLASSSSPERIAHSLALTGLSAHFEGRIFSASMVPRAKPAPDLFLHAAAAMGAEPGRSLVIEDSVNGVLAGKAAGMTVWGFTGGSHHANRNAAAALAAAGADRVLAAMDEFAIP